MRNQSGARGIAMTLTEQILADLPGDPLGNLHRADQRWQALKSGTIPIPQVVKESPDCLGRPDWDVVVCGGTLGIMIGAALAQQGWRVALIERGILRGRAQEWNISRQELMVLQNLGLLSAAELEGAIASEYNPARIYFAGGPEFWVEDVLNVGVDPVYLLEVLKTKFLAAGGQLFEQTPFEAAIVHPDGVNLEAGSGFKTRLLLDVMGHFSPIVQQARQGQKPDGICLVVGSCAQGFPSNESGDLFVSFTPAQNHCQYFWEAFPARDGRTTYLFTYLDAHPDRISLTTLFEDYLRLLPQYQQIDLDNLQLQRALFGVLPSYRHSPLPPTWSRILQVGDSSGAQSPLSFGGFGAMLRHLSRLSAGIHSALETDALSRSALRSLQPYQPNLAVTWMFQRAMSIDVDQQLDPNQINRLLSSVFQEMHQLGPAVLRPFLQDVVQFSALSRTLLPISLKHPHLVLSVLPQVGPSALLHWLVHYINLGGYRLLFALGQGLSPWIKALPPRQQHDARCWLEALRYGSGSDYAD